MNLEKTSLVLKKINRLYELIEDIGEANQTEKDLLKAYVIDLYEAVTMPALIDEEEDPDEEEMKERIKKKKKKEKKLQKQLEKKRKQVDLDDEEEDDEDDDDMEYDGSDELSPKDEEEDNASSEDRNSEDIQDVIKDDPEMDELFEIKTTAELSDKLANSPIADLTKAMGLNEKIFTVNELFGGNQSEMENILLALDGLGSFEEAKSVLRRSVATKYNWTEVTRIKKAKNFIRLVRRRYL